MKVFYRNILFALLGGIILISLLVTLLVFFNGEPENGAETTPITTPGTTAPGTSTTLDASGTTDISGGTDESGFTLPPITTPPPLTSVLPAATVNTETQTLRLTEQNTVLVNSVINFPKIVPTEASAAADKINKALSDMAESYAAYANDSMLAYAKDALAAGDPDSALPYRLNASYQVRMNTRSMFSVVFTSTVFTGGSHEYSESKAVNLGSDGTNYTLSKMFRVDSATYQKRIWDAVIAQIGDKTENYFTEYKELIKSFPLEGRLYFTEAGLNVIYNPYEISNYAEGILHFTLPYETVSDLLAVNPLY